VTPAFTKADRKMPGTSARAILPAGAAAADCRAPLGFPPDTIGGAIDVAVPAGTEVAAGAIVSVGGGVRVGVRVRVGPKVGKGRSVAVGPIGRGVAVGAAQALNNKNITKTSANSRISILIVAKVHKDYTSLN
jgi:hypothetical protein